MYSNCISAVYVTPFIITDSSLFVHIVPVYVYIQMYAWCVMPIYMYSVCVLFFFLFLNLFDDDAFTCTSTICVISYIVG